MIYWRAGRLRLPGSALWFHDVDGQQIVIVKHAASFIIPYSASDWANNLKKPIFPLAEQKAEERKYSILGGGDIGSGIAGGVGL